MFRHSIIVASVLFIFISFFFTPVWSPAGQYETGTIQNLSAPAAYSGSWYSPHRNYEGFEFQVLDNGNFLIIYYTYPGPTDNAQAQQSFILGVGTIEGTTAQVIGAQRTHGPIFGEDYEKDDLQVIIWGDFRVEFFDENNARVEYDGADGSGVIEITRLTSLVDPTEDGNLPSGMSAVWYNPETNGQGWFVEVLSSKQALVYMFTYDANGNQAWSQGLGEIVGASIQVPEMLAGKGTRFGDEFKSEDITLEAVAQLSIEFKSCNVGNVTVLTASGKTRLTYPVERVTNILGHGCTGLPPRSTVRGDGSRLFFIATSSSDSTYFRELGISIDSSKQYIFKLDIDNGEVVEVESNVSPEYARSTIRSYTVDDRYYVRDQSEVRHYFTEYDPLSLAFRSRIEVWKQLSTPCSAITENSYFYRVKRDCDGFGCTGGEFMRLDLTGTSTFGPGVQVPANECYGHLNSSKGVLYDAIYLHEYSGTTAGIGLYTRDPVSGAASGFAEFYQPDADQFTNGGYSFHFDGNTVYIVRVISGGGFQVLQYVRGVDTVPVPIYSSGADIPSGFYPYYRDVDDGYVALSDDSGFLILIDAIKNTIQFIDISTDIYDMAFLHVPK